MYCTCAIASIKVVAMLGVLELVHQNPFENGQLDFVTNLIIDCDSLFLELPSLQ